MKIVIGETPCEVPQGTTLHQLRDARKPRADIVCLNGAPVEADVVLSEGDSVVFIRRGEMPVPEELEFLMMARHSPGVHARMKQACVGIAGLGGLGSAIAMALGRMGVGRLVLVDFDVVEPSNLNRQHYFIDQIGMLKTEALVANLQRVNPYLHYETHSVRLTPENVPSIFCGVDVLAEAFDSAEAKEMICEVFCGAFPDKPIVMASGVAGYESGNAIVTRRFGRNVYVAGDGQTEARPGMGLMAPRVGIAAHHQANAVVRLLLGEREM